MTGAEIDFVVADSLKALELYERIFEVERVEVSNFPKGENEVVFNLYGMFFHMLDENEKFGLKAPTPGETQPVWFNIIVPDINATFAKAAEAGCTPLQQVTEMPDYGVSNAFFSDPFGYLWMLHQVHRDVSHEERLKLWENQRGQ